MCDEKILSIIANLIVKKIKSSGVTAEVCKEELGAREIEGLSTAYYDAPKDFTEKNAKVIADRLAEELLIDSPKKIIFYPLAACVPFRTFFYCSEDIFLRKYQGFPRNGVIKEGFRRKPSLLIIVFDMAFKKIGVNQNG